MVHFRGGEVTEERRQWQARLPLLSDDGYSAKAKYQGAKAVASSLDTVERRRLLGESQVMSSGKTIINNMQMRAAHELHAFFVYRVLGSYALDMCLFMAYCNIIATQQKSR